MTERPLLVTVAEGVATLTLNRPERLNALTAALHEELAAALWRLGDDDSVRALMITGAGRGFCAGQDLSERKPIPGGA
jgi:2-(1,2-epoxy-1,2-dihydrophenyl)acetyl-CoA isomerase